MTNYYARTEYDGDGIEDDFDFTWSYISASHVHVYVDDVEVTTGWSLSTSSRVTFVTPPADGTVVRIQRETSRATRLVDYVGGSALTEASLDTDSLQAHYMAQEAIDVSTAGIVEALAAVTGTGSVPGISTPADNNKVLLVDAGVAKWQKVGTVNMNFTPPSLSDDNTFLGENFFNDIVTVAATLTVTHDDDGATAGPNVLTYRTSASPAADDFIGGYQFGGANSAAAAVVYGEIRGQIKDATDSTEDGQIAITVSQDGSLVDEARVGLGMSVGASNTPQGVGTLNCSGFHRDNTEYPLRMATVATTSGTAVEISAEAIPAWAKRVTVLLNRVSFSGTDTPMLQLKDTSYVTTGYSGSTLYTNATSAVGDGDVADGWAGVQLVAMGSTSEVTMRFVFELDPTTANRWITNGTGILTSSSTRFLENTWATITLSSALTALRITSVGGSVTLTAGDAIVIVE